MILPHSELYLRAHTSLFHHAYVCSAGSQGYHALKEMLQNGTPGHTVLLESGDLREVLVGGSTLTSCLVYSSMSPILFREQLRSTTTHLSIYSNLKVLPHQLLHGGQHVQSVDLGPLSNVIDSINTCMLFGCTSLKSIDLTPFQIYQCCIDYSLGGVRA